MPHSSGGGSHGGGSHGGSHGGGSRGGRSVGPTISRGYFKGSTRYVYYRKGEPRYFYADKSFKPGIQWSRLLILFFYLPFLFVMVPAVIKEIPIAKKNYNHNIVISDEADVISDEQALYDSLERFMKKTGVTPSVVTIYNDDWAGSGSLENYAYSRYLREFDDEMHWLIVYAEEKYPSGSYKDWYWEGMQGDDTDNIINSAVAARFNSDLHSRLESDDRNVGAQLIASFDNITASYRKSINWGELGSLMCFLGFILLHMFFMVFWGIFKYRNAEPAPEETDTFGVPASGNGSYTGTKTGYSGTSPYSQTSTKPDLTGNSYGSSQYEMPDLISGTGNSSSYGGSQAGEIMCEFCGNRFSSRLKYCPHCNARNPDNL